MPTLPVASTTAGRGNPGQFRGRGVNEKDTEMNENTTETLTFTIGAVRTRDGWLGQVLMGGRILWESEDGDIYEKNALEEAHYRVIDKLGDLLRQPTDLELSLAAEEADESAEVSA